jgi:DNA-binding CsgD family transcriptional regulator
MQRILHLIGEIYSCAEDTARWPEVMEGIAKSFGAMAAALSGCTPEGNAWVVAPRGGAAAVALRRDVLLLQNPFLRNPMPMRPDTPVPGEGLSAAAADPGMDFPPELTVLGSTILMGDGEAVDFLVSSRRGFSERHVRLHETLAPHVVRALHLSRKLHGADIDAAVTTHALDRLQEAALLVDGDLNLIRTNLLGEALLGAGTLQLSARQLTCDHAPNADRLRDLVLRCRIRPLGVAAESVAITREGMAPITIAAYPISLTDPPMGMACPGAVLFVRDPEHRRSQIRETLVRGYGLTSAEATLALEMLRGDGKHAAAMRLGITYGTARAHLSRIFEKTGVRRQAELVRMLNELR